LVLTSSIAFVTPVTLPPGLGRLATNPSATGSPTAYMTMGIVVVARIAAFTAGGVPARMTSTFAATSSAASAASRS
jgi:hypothetical protein